MQNHEEMMSKMSKMMDEMMGMMARMKSMMEGNEENFGDEMMDDSDDSYAKMEQKRMGRMKGMNQA